MFRTNGFPNPIDPSLHQLNQASLPKLNDENKLRQKKSQQQQPQSETSINLNNYQNNQVESNIQPQQQPAVAQSHLLNYILGIDGASASGAAIPVLPPSNLNQRNADLDIRSMIVEPTCENSSSNKCSKSCPQRNIYDPNEYRASSRDDSRDEQPK